MDSWKEEVLFRVLVCGGRGDNTYDYEMQINAKNLHNALHDAEEKLGYDEEIVEISMEDY